MEIFGSLNSGFFFGLPRGDLAEKSCPASTPKFSFGLPGGDAIEKDFPNSTPSFSFGLPEPDVAASSVAVSTSNFAFPVLPFSIGSITTNASFGVSPDSCNSPNLKEIKKTSKGIQKKDLFR